MTDNLVDRYIHLCHAYTQLADKFHKLDLEHMQLRSNVVPALKALKLAKPYTEQLIRDNLALRQQLQEMTAQYEYLKPLAALLDPGNQAILAEAEEQMSLVNATVLEQEGDPDPDLSDSDKGLLHEYATAPEQFIELIPELTGMIPELTGMNGTALHLQEGALLMPLSPMTVPAD